jgi:hypothetical protein
MRSHRSLFAQCPAKLGVTDFLGNDISGVGATLPAPAFPAPDAIQKQAIQKTS